MHKGSLTVLQNVFGQKCCSVPQITLLTSIIEYKPSLTVRQSPANLVSDKDDG